MSKKDLTRLEEITAEMADAIRPMFQGMDRSQYIAYLHTMHHFLQETGQRLKNAVEICEDEDLQDLFSRAAGNAEARFELVKSDLEALKEEPSDNEVPEAIGQFDEFWASIDGEHEVAFLGAFYVLENLGEYIRDDVASALDDLDLKDDQKKFLPQFLESDYEVLDLTRDLAGKYVTTKPKQLFNSARTAADLWVEIHRSALE